MAKRKSDVGTLYKGSPGQWSWLLHRITGVAVILFLFAHVVDTAVVGWGPEAYNRVISVYHNWVVKLLELGLVAAVLYHSINGLKVTLIDVPGTYVAEMTPGSTERHNSPNFHLRAAVIETLNGPYFIKLTGPAKTVAASDKQFEAFLSSVKFTP